MSADIYASDESMVAEAEYIHGEDIPRTVTFAPRPANEPTVALACWWCSSPYEMPARLATWLGQRADVISACQSCRGGR